MAPLFMLSFVENGYKRMDSKKREEGAHDYGI